MADGTVIRQVVPILVYHSVCDHPSDWIAPFTVTPAMFEAHLDAIGEAGATPLTVSALVDALGCDPLELPERPVVVTFDDGFVDFREPALRAMMQRGICSTLYVTTGFVESGVGPHGDRMLDWAALDELQASDVELGGHSHSHPHLDTLTRSRAAHEIRHCKALLEQRLRNPVRSFAYPHGYSSPGVRRIVREAGYDSACAVGNALSHSADDHFRLARLMVRSHTTSAHVAAWLTGEGAPLAERRERARTLGWRAYRRLGARTSARWLVQP